jgi:transposase
VISSNGFFRAGKGLVLRGRKKLARVHAMRTNRAALLEQTQALRARVKSLEDVVKDLRIENEILQEKIRFLTQRLFGRTSEKVDRNQLELLLGDVEEASLIESVPEGSASRMPQRRKSRGERKVRIPAGTPTEDIVIDPEEVKQEPDAYEHIGEEITHELDIVPHPYIHRRFIRRKYKSKTDRNLAPIVAPAPPRLIENSIASVGLLVDMILKKYVDHRVPRASVMRMNRDGCGTTQPMRESKAPRDRLTGVGLKSPLAAVVKSHSRERRRKRPPTVGQMGDREMNASEPSLTCRNVYQLRSKPGGCGCPGIEQGRSLFRTLRPPASRWHEPVMRRLCGTWEPSAPMPTEWFKQWPCKNRSREAVRRDGTVRSSVDGPDKGFGAKELCSGGWFARSTGNGRNR